MNAHATPLLRSFSFPLALSLGLSLSLGACKRDDTAVAERLDRIAQRLDELNQKLDRQPRGAGAAGVEGPQRAQRPKPNPELTYSIPIDQSPIRGDRDGLVTIVEAFDFACPYCEQSRSVMAQVLETYPKDVRVAYKHYIIHPGVATIPAQAACAAAKQGKFDELEPLIWDKGYKANRDLGAENMAKLAGEVGLDVARFKADMAGEECVRRVRQDQTELAQVGIGSTPSFFVNGRWVPKRSPEAFRALIDEELKKAKERVAQGTRPDHYYQDWVVAKGQKKL